MARLVPQGRGSEGLGARRCRARCHGLAWMRRNRERVCRPGAAGSAIDPQTRQWPTRPQRTGTAKPMDTVQMQATDHDESMEGPDLYGHRGRIAATSI